MRMRTSKLISLLVATALVACLAVPATGMALVKPQGVRPQVDFTGRPDAYESRDDSPTTAPRLPEVSYHTFDTEDDMDWSIISAETTGQPFVLETLPIAGAFMDTEIHVFEYVDGEFRYPSNEYVVEDVADYHDSHWGWGQDGFDYNDDTDLWGDSYASTVYFVAPHPGTYFVCARMNWLEEYASYYMRISKGIAARIEGANRFATAAAVSKTMWSNTDIPSYGTGYGPDYCVVANGLDFPDALAGSQLALQEGTSVLLTKRDELPAETAGEIDRLAESRYWDYDEFTVYVLGGTASVSDAVLNRIKSMKHVTKVVRVAGADRFATATAVAEETSKTAGGFSNTVFVVNGLGFADALSAGPVAYEAGAPILLTRTSSLPKATFDYLKQHFQGADVYVVGSTASVDGYAVKAIQTAVGPTGSVVRVAGRNRYVTSQNLAQLGVDEFGMDTDSMTLVSGETFADGLAASQLSYWTGAPLLLTPRDFLGSEVRAFAVKNGPTYLPSYVVGGAASVSPAAYNGFRALWKVFPEDV